MVETDVRVEAGQVELAVVLGLPVPEDGLRVVVLLLIGEMRPVEVALEDVVGWAEVLV